MPHTRDPASAGAHVDRLRATLLPGFGVQGLGFRVWGLGFGVPLGLYKGSLGVESRLFVLLLGFRVSGFGCSDCLLVW